MSQNGTYSKDRQRITQPVTRVPSSAVPQREPDAPVAHPRESSGGVVFVNRTTGWALALLFIGVLSGIAWTITAFFTREHQIEHMDAQQREQQRKIEELKLLVQALTRRVVLLETEIEIESQEEKR